MRFKDFLQENIVVFDGAFGTMLQRETSVGTLPELVNIERPDLVLKIHRQYAAAGADVISADTFGANAYKAGSYELSGKLIRAVVKRAREAAKDKFVALDLGPVGKLMEPAGPMTFDEAYDIFAHAVEAGKEGADLILLETMTDLYELKAALLAAREHSDLPVIASMTFEQNLRTFMGCDAVCYALTASPLADAIGVNCSTGPDQLESVIRTLKNTCTLPIIAKPNAGMPKISDSGEAVYSMESGEFAQHMERLVEAGASLIGGCCGTTPEFIEALRGLKR